VTTPNYTETLRQAVTQVLGAPPDDAPLDAQMLDVQTADGIRREHLKYQVAPGDWGCAYLLRPEGGNAALPTVYLHHQHNYTYNLGKTEILNMGGVNLGEELVRQGYAVFAPDALGFGERRSPHSTGADYDREYNTNHLTVRLLRGETLLRKVIWDVSRGVDYLLTRADVDPRRIAFMGSGYGARMALWAMALDTRIRAGVAYGGIGSMKENVRRGVWFTPEFIVPRLMQVADIHHILSLVAPRPFLISVAADDPVTADAEDVYRRALPSYERGGAAHRLALYQYEGAFSLNRVMRFNAYAWLNSWLKGY